jgi:hypothetical protein
MNCPDIHRDNGEINIDTRSSIAELERFFLDASLRKNFVETRNDILLQFPEADQWLITHLFINNLCQLISDSHTGPGNKYAILDRQLDKLYRRVPSRCVASTRIQAKGIGPKLRRSAARIALVYPGNGAVLVDFAFGPLASLDRPARLMASETVENSEAEFLRHPPLVVTKANKYFVIVASVRTEEGAVNTMKRLKRKVPQFDFEVCAPSGSDPYHAIIVAAWVSDDVAKQSLALAREHIAKDSYIWACPNEGTSC